jgi:hypothetical protein
MKKFKTIGLEQHVRIIALCQGVVQQGILSASKMILTESDLIHERVCCNR